MDKRYFHFPLCLLSFGRDNNERLNGIIWLGCVELGFKQWQTFGSTQRKFAVHVRPPLSFCTCTIDLSKDEELQLIAGCEYLT